jgi:hypothetical protein
MIVEQIWTANAYRNFNYLIACPESGEALAIDPLDHRKCLAAAKARGWEITQILNTHEHGDHIGGNKAMVAATGAKVLAHRNAKGRIPEMDRGLGAGDLVKVGRTVELEVLDTPGHTMSHVCLLSHTDQPGCSAATPCSTPAPATATTAAIPTSSTTPSPNSSRSCPRPRWSIPATTTSPTTCASRWTASRTTPRRRSCWARSTTRIPATPWSPAWRRKRRSTPSSGCRARR